ncbi:hypothetical protein E2C01_007313 [Portunus trituberculatus]|uniref:Uncharacterized protein n=1 Tax=Portunus trituberculatus TaxID=210409 RepID=A0A5B7CZT1_PORTR|nr:hypothetical protein [Portunus trituberculatus]
MNCTHEVSGHCVVYVQSFAPPAAAFLVLGPAAVHWRITLPSSPAPDVKVTCSTLTHPRHPLAKSFITVMVYVAMHPNSAKMAASQVKVRILSRTLRKLRFRKLRLLCRVRVTGGY